MDLVTLVGLESSLILRILASALILVAGILIGNLITYVLEKLVAKLEFGKKVSRSFVMLSIAVLRWCIYIAFIIWALDQLQIPSITHYITKVLVTIPAITSAIIIIVAGFALAVYLRTVVEDSEVTGWRMLSQLLFYFIIYIAIVYALSLALVLFDPVTRNMIIFTLTAIVATAAAIIIVRRELRESHLHK